MSTFWMGKAALGGVMVIAASAAFGVAEASEFKVLHVFNGSDGATPGGGLLRDKQGNLFGVTELGGSSDGGVAYKLAPDGTLTILHSFTGGTDGQNPVANLIEDKAGNLYGVTQVGGNTTNCHFGCGTVFKIAPDGTESVLYAFTGRTDGDAPSSGVTLDRQGNLRGVTYFGGIGFGNAFKLAPDGTATNTYSFRDGEDGSYPIDNLVDAGGTLYGTASDGTQGAGGDVYKINPDGTETTLWIFNRANKLGAVPEANVVRDNQGNLYGTTSQGGDASACELGCGVVYEIAKNGNFKLLHTFEGADGAYSYGGVTEDAQGNLYGTTYLGGANNKGVVFKLTPGGRYTVLHSFTGSDGANPGGSLVADKHGFLYGVTNGGGQCGNTGCGTIFRVKE